MPSEKTIGQKLTPQLNRKIQFKIKEIIGYHLENNGSASITTDIWTSPSRDSFLSFTIHFVTQKFERKLAILRCMKFDTDHTSENLAIALKNVAKNWGISNIHLLVRDNATNMVNAAKMMNVESIGCFCHILNLIVNHAVISQSGVAQLRSKSVLSQIQLIMQLVTRVDFCFILDYIFQGAKDCHLLEKT